MLYKTIMLEMLHARPRLYEQLRSQRILLKALDQLALDLKACQQAWEQELALAHPAAEPALLASQALERGIKDMQDRLPPESPYGDEESLSLDEAMDYLRPTQVA